MSDQRDGGIEWTDETWNPIRGCSKVSQGCRNCYAETMAARFSGPGQPYEGTIEHGRWNGSVKFVPERLGDPLRWKRPRMVFVNSMSDLFHESLAFEDIARVYAVMQLAQTHTFQVLTKRPARALAFYRWLDTDAGRAAWLKAVVAAPDGGRESWSTAWPFRNIWLGVSIEDQKTADERIPLLLQCPAAVRWVSAEPLLGAIDLAEFLYVPTICPACNSIGGYYDTNPEGRPPLLDGHGEPVRCAFGVEMTGEPGATKCSACHGITEEYAPINWVVVGGESGPGARPMHPDWARSLRDQCVEAGVPFLFKQWGDWAPWIEDGGQSYSKGMFWTYNDDPVFPGEDMTGISVPLKGVNPFRQSMVHVGKHVAGRELDGKVWDGYPVLVAP